VTGWGEWRVESGEWREERREKREERSVMALRGDDRDENRPSCRPTREHRAIFGRREKREETGDGS